MTLYEVSKMLVTKKQKEEEKKEAYVKTQGSMHLKSYSGREECRACAFIAPSPLYREVRLCGKKV